MSSEITSEARRRQLEELVRSYETAADPERQLLRLVISSASARDPELGKLISYCAIPRYFDAEIIGVLRQAPDEHETNHTFFAKLAQLNFTRARSDGRCAYADSSRDALLEHWRDPAQRELFDELNQRLAAYHQQNYEKVERLESDLVLIAPAVRRANPSRLSQLTTQIERRIIDPLLEALYHKNLQSAQVAYSFFESGFFNQEARRRFTICETLRFTTLAYVKESPAGDEQTRLLRWLTYWEGRVARQLRMYDQAETIFRKLLPETGEDVRLKLWTLGELGATLAQQSKNREARDTYQQEIAHAEETGIDPYNLPTRYLRLGDLHWYLEELELAATKYQEAIRLAADQNIGTGISARIQLSGVLHTMGQWSEALDLIIEAHHLARTKLGNDRGMYRSVVYQMQSLLARRDARLLDTLAAEIEESTAADARDPSVLLQARQEYFRLLRQGGQLTRSEELLEKIWPELWESADAVMKNTLLLEKALFREEQGRFEEVIALYDELIRLSEGVPDAAYYYGAALSNRGMMRSKVGRWQEAEADLRAALDKWQEGSNEKISGLIKAAMATAQRLQGKLEQAQVTLYEARDFFKEGNSTYKTGYLGEQGDLFAARGEREEARKTYLEALELYRSRDEFKSSAVELGKLAKLAADEGKWSEAAHHSDESLKLWQKLAKLDSYRPSAAAMIADAENATGVQAFFVNDDQRTDRILQAQSSFLKASELVPDNFWYQLNLSYASAELEQWDAAAAAVLKVLANSPTWLHAPKLYERLKAYRLEQGDKLFKRGSYQEAARVYSESLAQLKGKLQDNSIRELELRLGDSRLKLGEVEKAETSYENGLKSIQDGDNVSYKTVFPARLGFARALRLDLAGALRHFKASIDEHRKLQSTNPVDDIVATVGAFSELLITNEQFRVTGESLRLLAANTAAATDEANALIQARLSLSKNRYQVVRRSTKESARAAATTDVPVTTPITLEADARLFPEDQTSGVVERLVNSELPFMRDQVFKTKGVNIPGVKVKADESFIEGQYNLLLFEIPLEGGIVFADKKFCPDAKACLELKLNGDLAAAPTGSGEGMWLNGADVEKAAVNALPLYDPYQFMVLHLESLIHRHLASFLGIQEVQFMIDQWKAEANGERQSLAEAALPDETAMVRLVQVFQRLAQENIPVRNLSSILSSFADVNSRFPELIQVAEAARFAIRADFADNSGTQFIELPPEFEEKVANFIRFRDGKKYVALSLEKKAELVGAVKEIVAAQDTGDLSVVVAKVGLRPFVRSVLQEDFPELGVFAASEVRESSTAAHLEKSPVNGN